MIQKYFQLTSNSSNWPNLTTVEFLILFFLTFTISVGTAFLYVSLYWLCKIYVLQTSLSFFLFFFIRLMQTLLTNTKLYLPNCLLMVASLVSILTFSRFVMEYNIDDPSMFQQNIFQVFEYTITITSITEMGQMYLVLGTLIFDAFINIVLFFYRPEKNVKPWILGLQLISLLTFVAFLSLTVQITI